MDRISKFFAQFPTLLSVITELNNNQINWMIGGSGCLYLLGNKRIPDDVDIYLADNQHDQVDALFGIQSFTFISDQERVRNSNPLNDHSIQLTSQLTLTVGGQSYRFDFGEESYLRQRQRLTYKNQAVYLLAAEDVLVIKGLLQRGLNVGKNDVADIYSFQNVYPQLNQEYLRERIHSLRAETRVQVIWPARNQ